jgi:hypothetical protein
MSRKQMQLDEGLRRLAIMKRAADACVEAIETAAQEYGPTRFKKNGAHGAIIHEVETRLAKPGRKPSAKPAGRKPSAKKSARKQAAPKETGLATFDRVVGKL